MHDENSYLAGIHPQLASVVVEAVKRFEQFSGYTVRVTSGYRTAEEQMALYRSGKSKTTKSAHMQGRAVDLAILRDKGRIYEVRGEWYVMLDRFMQQQSREFDVIIGWGGHWKMRDYGHWWIAEDDWQKEGVKLLSSLASS